MSSKIDFSLYLITDRSVLPAGSSLSAAVRKALEGGVKCIQVREKDLPPGALFDLALEVRQLTRRFGAKLLINDRADVALACDADGVHLTSSSLPVPVVRKIVGPERLIGISTHHTGTLRKAAEEGADFATFGPVYFTPSKAAYGPPMGIEKLREACRATRLPVFALGGVTFECLQEIAAAGAAGIALISAILSCPDPRAQAERFLTHFPIPQG